MSCQGVRRSFLVLAVIGMGSTGCSTNKPIFYDDPNHSDAVTELNRRAETRTATVAFSDGRTIQVQALKIEVDLASWLDPETRKAGTAPTSTIVDVRFNDQGTGVLQGLGLGILIGGASLGLAGLVDGDDTCPRGRWCLLQMTAEEKAALGASAGAILGGLAGLITGAVRGSTTKYRFVASPVVEPTEVHTGKQAAGPPPPKNRMTMDEWQEYLERSERSDSTQVGH